MKHLATILLLALCATAPAQTIKTLGYNTTNGEVVYSGTNTLTFTNAFSFSTNAIAAEVRTNLQLGATWLTNTDVTNFRTAINLGPTNDVIFKYVEATNVFIADTGKITLEDTAFVEFSTVIGAAKTARALAGTTNTNEPYSGQFRFTDPSTSTDYEATVTNGLILTIEEL